MHFSSLPRCIAKPTVSSRVPPHSLFRRKYRERSAALFNPVYRQFLHPAQRSVTRGFRCFFSAAAMVEAMNASREFDGPRYSEYNAGSRWCARLALSYLKFRLKGGNYWYSGVSLRETRRPKLDHLRRRHDCKDIETHASERLPRLAKRS